MISARSAEAADRWSCRRRMFREETLVRLFGTRTRLNDQTQRPCPRFHLYSGSEVQVGLEEVYHSSATEPHPTVEWTWFLVLIAWSQAP